LYGTASAIAPSSGAAMSRPAGKNRHRERRARRAVVVAREAPHVRIERRQHEAARRLGDKEDEAIQRERSEGVDGAARRRRRWLHFLPFGMADGRNLRNLCQKARFRDEARADRNESRTRARRALPDLPDLPHPTRATQHTCTAALMA